MRRFIFHSIVLLWLAMWPIKLLGSSGEGDRSDTVQSKQEQVNLALENADIKELIRWASLRTQKNIILHPQVTGKVTVLAGAPMDPDEAYEVFLSVLSVHGLTVVENGEAIRVIPTKLANESSPALIGDETPAFREDVVVRIIKIKNVAAIDLVSLLRPMVPQDALLNAYAATNLLIVSDRAANIDRVMQIIQQIDQAGLVDIQVIPLEFASAGEVINVIDRLIPSTGNGAAKPYTIAEDARSNSLLMTGNPIALQQLRGLVQKLDRPLKGEGNTQVVFVNFADAKTLVPILQSISGSAQKASRDQSFANVDVKIEVSEENNALIITAPPALQDTMRAVIRQLDVRRPQVLVEALIVEVNDEVARDLGVEWFTNEDQPFTAIGAQTGAVSTPQPPNFGEGLTFGYFRGGELRALLRALEADTEANILSTPTIVSLDNEEAEILVGSNVPFVTGQSTGSSSSTNNPFQTIQRQDIGVTLRVRPRINHDDSITLAVEQSVETLSPAVASDIITSKREIKTKVLIENNEVLVLGGLIDEKITDVERGVPVLRSVPVLGHAFKSKRAQVTKNNLMVFIRPVILRSRQANESVTRDRYDSFRNLQRDFNRPQLFQLPGMGKDGPLLDQWQPSETNPQAADSSQDQ